MNTRQLGKLKREKVLKYLAKWHYSTQGILCQLLDSKITSQSRFFAKLLSEKIIKEVPQSVLKEKLFMLTNYGKSLALELTVDATTYSTDLSKVNLTKIRHDLKVQQVCLGLSESSQCKVVPERQLMQKGEKNKKKPDAIFDTGTGEVIAVEVELSYKKRDDIFRAFVNLWRLRNDEQFPISRVHYYFGTSSMMEHYLSVFQKPKWPLFRLENNKWVFERQLDADGARNKLADFFKFKKIEDYTKCRPHDCKTLQASK